MFNILSILAFIALYALSMTGGKKGKVYFFTGLVIHAGYIIYRFIHLGWLPVTERYDILLLMSFGVATSFFYLKNKIDLNLILDTIPMFAIMLSLFAVFQVRMDTIDPTMNSGWFYGHIIFLILGYVFFTVSTAVGIIYLRKKSVVHEVIQYRLTLFGWLLFSFSLIGGSTWFFLTYGSYWLWTAKELWITVVWFYYSFYLHSRMMKSLSGRPAVIMGIVGFPIIIFSYLGVMPILGSPWSQF
jgi:ABC-type transport system involved in cytochrome c biogenesis permease subunit